MNEPLPTSIITNVPPAQPEPASALPTHSLAADPPLPPPPRRGRAALWRNRDYMLLWSGQVVSMLGSTITQIALPLLILSLTGSAAAAGIASGLGILPYVLFSLPVGALVDRWDRKRMMMLCDAGRAVNIASIPLALLFNSLIVEQLYVVAFIEGSLFVFFDLAEVAALQQVVRKDQVADATGQNQATFAVAGLIGPALGGLLYQLGRAFPFVTDAVSFTVSVISMLFIRTRFQEVRDASDTGRNLRREIGEGLAWLWHQPVIRFMAFLTGGFNFTTAGWALFIIISAKRQGADEVTIGLIFSIGSIGALLGSLVAGRIKRRFQFGQIIISSVWLSALIIPLYAIAPNILVLGLISIVFFFTGPIYSVAMISYRLPLIPDLLQGRVNSVFRMLAFGLIAPGAALAGILIESIDLTPTILFFSVCLAVIAVIVTLNPAVRAARWAGEEPAVEHPTHA